MVDGTLDQEGLIRLMPDTLANKIAAGEVVQRPASALKELVENSIDAGASQVTVVLKKAGSELVQVIDDGCGMGPADALACFQRHATSKITAIEDLEHIQTLGFRGEALASIAAVAQVELKTRRMADEAGLRVRVDGGKHVATEPCATPSGTSVAVRNLFYNVPARRNFLKSPATEFKHLVETFQFLALANPRVGFTLVHDDNEVYRLTAAPSTDPFEALRHRILDLFSKDHDDELVPVEETTSYLSVHGFVGRPEFNRKTRGEQFLFVNGRYVKNRYLEHAITTGYAGLLPDGAYPFFALFLRLDPRHVDVNVHPTKAEVKFDDERGVYAFMRAVVKKGLGEADLTPQLGDGFSRDDAAPARPAFTSMPRPVAPVRSGGGAAPAQPTPSRTTITMPATGSASLGDLSDRLYAPSDADDEAEEVLASGAQPLQPEQTTPGDEPLDVPLLWQLDDRYILTQIRSGLMVVDQNAAHERILYEKALQSMTSGFGLSQQLLFPHTLDFSPADHELLLELLPDLRALGFDVEPFSGRSMVVRGVPADIHAGDERSILDDILQQYKANREALKVPARENLAKSIARRSAIRSGVRLSEKEMRSLIDQLFLCEMPYACPTGRPTIVKLPFEELDKRFGR